MHIVQKKVKTPGKFVKFLLILSGSISVGLGFIGIFVPMLPTTPFLLLAAACYAKSSPKFYFWLMNNRWLGRYIRDYKEKRGMRLRSKIISISSLNISIALSIIYATEMLWVRIILAIIAVSVTIHLLRIKTLK